MDRLQRFAQAASVATFLASPVAGISLFLLLLRSPFGATSRNYGRGALVLYLLWIFVFDNKIQNRGGRPSQWLRRLTFWRYFREYFPAHIIRCKTQLNPKQKYIVGLHPHGVVSMGAFCHFISDNNALPGIDYRVLTVPENFRIPFWRDLVLAGGLVSADRSSCRYLLENGISVCVVVGGAAEALDSRPGTNDLTLGRRLGFARLALEHGASLIPVFTFGETDVYEQAVPNPPGSIVRWIQEKMMSWFGYSLPLIWGKGFLPFRRPLTTVVGEPIPVPHIPRPHIDDILRVHGQYVHALQKIYDDHVEVLYPHRLTDLRVVDPLRENDKKLLRLGKKLGSEPDPPMRSNL
eukprot:TRINITY_DN841_c0_g1_i2.p1 TRINITY_DN841_c0_g1~~TRINITY_DN841_c0_g1_i2.p1  ORF type:complete len:350 (+),score=47.74 TRINITY_DN841_c0_g1_i2:98-1147(+)